VKAVRFRAGASLAFLLVASSLHAEPSDAEIAAARASFQVGLELEMAGDFADRDTVVYGVSIDSEFVHMNWRLHHDDLRTLPIAMLADIKRELATATGVLDKNEGVALRATFLVDPEGIIRYAAVNDLSVGRNPAEVLRVLDALQTDELCPCNWNKGEQVLRPAA
jgi:peroxiredoxin (alkyl hydroperoxide reductase subunit C)